MSSETIVQSCPKKSGKTALNAATTLWWAFTQEPPNEILIVANDLEQAQGRVFATICGLIRQNRELASSATLHAREILLSNGTKITAIASEYASAAGSNHGFTSWDELWGYTSESGRRLWEELTPVPTRKNSVRFVTTYAGFEGESELLWHLYLLGVGPEEHADGRGQRVHPTLPIYANAEARTLVYWDHEPRMPWQTPEYYATQRRTLRPGNYLRVHENRWVPANTVFITPELWDPCVDPDRSPVLASRQHALFIGVDAGIKHDGAAVVAVFWDDNRLVLGYHRIWRPTPNAPLNLEATIEDCLRTLCERHLVRDILCDPYQLHRSITTLHAAGLPIRSYPQTTAATTLMGQTLFDLLTGRTLRLYRTEDLRAQALNTVAIETVRGWRIAKERSSKKIDAIIALALACVAATEAGPQQPRAAFVEFVNAAPAGPHEGPTVADIMRWNEMTGWPSSGGFFGW